ncbi:ATP-dependent RNA helicase DHX30-like isoform X2 [Lycorma delicatula]
MMALAEYFKMLKTLNYSNIKSMMKTVEVSKNCNEVRSYLTSATKIYQSTVLLTLVSPMGKRVNISSCRKNIFKELAEREAVENLIMYIKHNYFSDLLNGKNNHELPRKPAECKKTDIEHLPSTHLIEQLPFYNDSINVSGRYNSTHLLDKNENFMLPINQNVKYVRYFSSNSSRGELDHVGGVTAAVVKENLNVCDVQSDSEFDKAYVDILRLPAFKAPKNYIGNLYTRISVASQSNAPLKDHKVQMTNSKHWAYTLNVYWPENQTFIGIGNNKKEASRRAAVKCIYWLLKTGKIDREGNVKMIDRKVIIKEKKKPLAEIKVNQTFIDEAEDLIQHYSDINLQDNLKKQAERWESNELELYAEFNQQKQDYMPSNQIDRINKELYKRLKVRKMPLDVKLPIEAYRSNVVDMIKENQVLVIKGEPGCGKSTQVPQMILDDYAGKMKATDCQIVVTQPRRISAITLAERIASERNEMVGDVVGYHVRLQSVIPRKSGSILFCSTGIMLRRLLSNPDMSGISHLIIDEAHERDLNTDFLLLLTKRAVKKNPDLRIIIMSATINPQLFQEYFNDAKALHIPGYTHPVTAKFLDENIAKITGIRKEMCNTNFPVVDIKAVSNLVLWINKNRAPGAILVFLPGWAEIRRLRDELKNSRAINELLILPLHSRLSYDDQRKIFNRPPNGIRKIILATNIAETSITVDDVNYVIDPGAHKEERLYSESGLLCLDNRWVSQASARQRRGRAGRVAPGECFHLYTREKFDSMDEFPLPEVHKVRLETSVLNSKIYSGNEKAEEFLKQLPEPPSAEMVGNAVSKLQWLGALDTEENLTPLGTRIAVFTTHPFISKALVHSYIFKCVCPLVTIGTILSSDVELFPGTMGDKTAVRVGKKKFSPSSDHLALTWLFHHWNEYNNGDHNFIDYKARRFAESINASSEAFRQISRLRHLVGEHLYECGLLENLEEFTNFGSDCNRYSRNHELSKGVLLSGLGNLLTIRKWDLEKGVLKKKNVVMNESGQRATISNESVNYKRATYPTPFMTYFTEVRSAQQRSITIRDTSLISPLTLVLFQCATVNINKCKDTALGLDLEPDQVILSLGSNKKTLNILCNERTAAAVIKLRQIMWTITGYLVREVDNPQDHNLFNQVKKFHNNLLSLLDKMLNEQSVLLDKDGGQQIVS